jgi:hypothetical protein
MPKEANMITKSIRNHINQLDKNEPFTTREFLNYGQRAAVDQTLSRLVKQGFIVRLAPGVFAREVSKEYTPLEIKTAKVKYRVMKAIAKFESHSSIQAEPAQDPSVSLLDCMSEFRRLSSNIQDLISQAS